MICVVLNSPTFGCVAGSFPNAASRFRFLGADDGTIDEDGGTCSSRNVPDRCNDADCESCPLAKTS